MKIGTNILNGRKFGVFSRPVILGRVCSAVAVGLVGLSISASAQLVSNLDEASAFTLFVSSSDWQSGQFTTGSNVGGYTLVSVTGKFDNQNSSGSFTAQIFSDNAGDSPNLSLESLTGPGPATAGNHTFASSGLALDANTSYWVVWTATSGTYVSQLTSSPDQTSSDGWTIGDSVRRSQTMGASWQGLGAGPIQFSIQATPVPEPHEYAMFVGLGLVGFVVARRRFASSSVGQTSAVSC